MPSSDLKNVVVRVLMWPHKLYLDYYNYTITIVKKPTILHNKLLTDWRNIMAKQRNKHSADIKRVLKRKLKSNKQKNA